MKSKKGFVDVTVICIVLILGMIWYGSTLTPEEQRQSRIDCEKSFGSPKGNVISGIKFYSDMTDAEKAEFDKYDPYSPSYK
jgi:hypothetical protein